MRLFLFERGEIMRKSFFISGIIIFLIFAISSNSFGDNQWISLGLEGESVTVLVINSQTPDTLYVGTGGGGVFKSTDGGVNWTAMNTGLPYYTNAGVTYIYPVSGVVINPQTPDTLYASIEDYGVFVSTDGGANWWAPMPSSQSPTNVSALVINPQAPNILYAGTDDGVYESTDGGANWFGTDPTFFYPIISALVINPQTPNTLYAGTDAYSYGGGVFESTDGGANWTVIYPGNFCTTVLVINPQTPDTLYVGIAFATDYGGGVFENTNGGAIWTPIDTGLTYTNTEGTYLCPVSALVINPQTPNILYAGTPGWGVFESTNGGANWTPMNTGLTNLYVTALVINPQTPDTLYVGTGGGGVFEFVSSVINISVTTTSVNFGSVNVGQVANQNITITNQASSNAALTGNVGTLSAPFSVVSGGGAFNLAPGQSVTVTVQFSPTTAGSASASLSITHNATNQTSPTNISLSGTAQYTLTVLKSGTGTGTVGSNPSGINCGVNCSETYLTVQKVRLTAKADLVSTFSGWSGVCSGTGSCLVTVNGPETVTATFTVKPPAITALSPTSGTVGSAITITGKYFGPSQGSSVVSFNGVPATAYTSWSNTTIKCIVPAGASTGFVVVTTTVGGASNGKTFTVKPPLITSLSPTSGTVGSAVTIKGKYFGPGQGSSTVSFNGIPVTTYTSWSDTIIKCTVPTGASTGFVVVTTSVGASNGKTFTVKP
jgi:hypothetical protein